MDFKNKTEEIRKSLEKGGKEQTPQAIAKKYANGDAEIEHGLLQYLQEEGKGKSPAELEKMAKVILGMDAAAPEGADDQGGGEDEDVTKSLTDDELSWREHVAMMRDELKINQQEEVIKSLEARIERQNEALLNLLDLVEAYGETVEKSTVRPQGNEAALQRLREAANRNSSHAGDQEIVQKSIDKQANGLGKAPFKDHELSAFSHLTGSGRPLPPEVRQKLEAFIDN